MCKHPDNYADGDNTPLSEAADILSKNCQACRQQIEQELCKNCAIHKTFEAALLKREQEARQKVIEEIDPIITKLAQIVAHDEGGPKHAIELRDTLYLWQQFKAGIK